MNKTIRLAPLVAERSLSVSGFRRAMKALVAEFESDPDGRADMFAEWFGDCRMVPAAWRVRRDPLADDIWGVTVEVYEIEGSIEIPKHRIVAYGEIADGDGPHIELHVLDRYDHEIVFSNTDLAEFTLVGLPARDGVEFMRSMLKRVRSQTTVQHHAPIIIDDSRLAEMERVIGALRQQVADGKLPRKELHARWKAAYDAVTELGITI